MDIKNVLSLIVTIAFVVLLFVLLYVKIDPIAEKALYFLAGTLVGIVKDIFGFFFGSSEGSARKTEMMNDTAVQTATDNLVRENK